MDVIRVILCGTDALKVETALRGTAEITHYAWNKRFTFSCATALSVDQIDKRVLLMSNVVLICKGCRLPKDTSSYENLPVLSLEDAPTSCVDQVSDSEFYYGQVSFSNIKYEVLLVAAAPTHILYDALLQCLTEKGKLALDRAFWILDKDCDGVLNQEELASWRGRIEPKEYTPNIETSNTLGALESAGKCSRDQFMEYHLSLFEQGRRLDAWATVYSLGTNPNGLPYSWYDIHSLRIGKDQNTYLSSHATQFFTNVYKLKRFEESENIWEITPACAWEDIPGFECGAMSLDTFVEQWKYMAVHRRDSVIIYARYWGYRGETAFLFQKKPCRFVRTSKDGLPNTLNVLVVGSERSGAANVVYAVAPPPTARPPKESSADLYVRTSTFMVRSNKFEEPHTILYTAVGPEKASLFLSDPEIAKLYDVVLLCYSASCVEETSRHLTTLYTSLSKFVFNSRLPFIMVETTDGDEKVVSKDVDPVYEALSKFCSTHQLLWPPVMANVTRPENCELSTLNEYVFTLAADPELAVGLPPLSPVRVLRRATVVAIVVVASIGVLSSIWKRVRQSV